MPHDLDQNSFLEVYLYFTYPIKQSLLPNQGGATESQSSLCKAPAFSLPLMFLPIPLLLSLPCIGIISFPDVSNRESESGDHGSFSAREMWALLWLLHSPRHAYEHMFHTGPSNGSSPWPSPLHTFPKAWPGNAAVWSHRSLSEKCPHLTLSSGLPVQALNIWVPSDIC